MDFNRRVVDLKKKKIEEDPENGGNLTREELE
jgi:hypothetical protein